MFRKPMLILWCLAATLARGGITAEDFLKTHGHEIHDRKQRAVVLHGVNLGGWLLFEPWMCPMDSSGLKDDFSAREVLARRFGSATAASLLRTYQENWITCGDLDNIAAHGMNVVRVPFWYRNLQTESGEWLPDAFNRLDWVITEAAKRGIYTLLDFHGAPGGQTRSDNTGRQREQAGFWQNEAHLQRTLGIWRTVAARYRGNPAVAAYDLLNEPAEAPSPGALWSAYDRIYREIRAADPDHIITVEGCLNARVGDRKITWGWEALPHPDLFKWDNTIYQMHNYVWDWNNLEKQNNGVDFQVADWQKHKSHGVPVLIGEFNPMAREEAWLHAIREFNKAGMNWTLWSYKASHGTGSDSWGMYNPVVKEAPDLLDDDAETIRRKWENCQTGKSYAPNPMLERVWKATMDSSKNPP